MEDGTIYECLDLRKTNQLSSNIKHSVHNINSTKLTAQFLTKNGIRCLSHISIVFLLVTEFLRRQNLSMCYMTLSRLIYIGSRTSAAPKKENIPIYHTT